MSSDNQYTALGPAPIGFQTHGANITNGAEVEGTNIGVRSKGGLQGVNGEGALVGVFGKGAEGVGGEGLIGVHGKGKLQGVSGEGLVGVLGVGSGGPFLGAAGVEGKSNDEGTGVRGTSLSGYAGEFITKSRAQIHLEPLPIPTPQGAIQGQGGDVVATDDSEGSFALWFCTHSGDPRVAQWKRIA
jgi:hypothetical protein